MIDHIICADGTDWNKLCVPAADPKDGRTSARTCWRAGGSGADGRPYVFKMATTRMAEVAQQILARNGLTPDDLSMVLMHQATGGSTSTSRNCSDCQSRR